MATPGKRLATQGSGKAVPNVNIQKDTRKEHPDHADVNMASRNNTGLDDKVLTGSPFPTYS